MLKLNMQFFGEDTQTVPAADGTAEETIETVNTDSEEIEQVESITHTQAELDALVNKSYAKGARAGKKEALAAAKVADKPEEKPNEDLQKQADERLAVANKRLIKGTVLSMEDEKLTTNGKKALLEFGNFEDCFDENGELNEDDVKDKMKEFAELYPEFSKKEESPNKVVLPPAGKVGDFTVTKEKFQKMTYQERLKVKKEQPKLYDELKE